MSAVYFPYIRIYQPSTRIYTYIRIYTYTYMCVYTPCRPHLRARRGVRCARRSQTCHTYVYVSHMFFHVYAYISSHICMNISAMYTSIYVHISATYTDIYVYTDICVYVYVRIHAVMRALERQGGVRGAHRPQTCHIYICISHICVCQPYIRMNTYIWI